MAEIADEGGISAREANPNKWKFLAALAFFGVDDYLLNKKRTALIST